MNKKYICCIHDKKSDTFDGFMIFDNINQAARAFQQACEKNETFKTWPEDFEFLLCGVIAYENGTLNEKGEIEKAGKVDGKTLIIGQAKEYVAITNAKNN